MNFEKYKVKHKKYTHIVISKNKATSVADIVWSIQRLIPEGMILLDMKAISKPLHPRFWEVKCEDGKVQWWKLQIVRRMSKALTSYCDNKHAEETI